MRVSSLHTYPIKGCRGLDHDVIDVEPWGLAGDRRWLVVDDDSGRAVTQREAPGLVAVRPSRMDGMLRLHAEGAPDLDVPEPRGGLVEVVVHRDALLATPAGDAAGAWLTTVLHRKVRLVWLDDPRRRQVSQDHGQPDDRVSFADAYPVLLTHTASLDALNAWIVDGGSPEAPVPMNRFRPNIVVSGAPPWAEDAWLTRRLRIGAVIFSAVKACERCVVTVTDQETGQRGREPLRTLAQYRKVDQKLLFGTNLIPNTTGSIAVGDPLDVL